MVATEIQILDWIQATFRSDIGDVIVPILTSLGNAGAVWLILAGVLLIKPSTRKTGAILWVALLADLVLCNILCKPIVARTRPFVVNPSVQLLINAPKDYSFPSGHTAASFAAVFALMFQKNKGWIPCMVLAVIIALTRLYLYVHFPTDVLGGVVIGVIAGYIGHKFGPKLYEFVAAKWKQKQK